MTRRARAKNRVPSLDAYIHRATLGRAREERLDAAAELRTHLLERVAEHQAQGFSREEAEYLAVKGMGEPQSVNRGLLGHMFTNGLGWAALAVLLVGGGGWYAWREWLPPGEGVQFEAATSADLTYLFTLPEAPRGTYQAMTLTLPKNARTLIYLNVAVTPAGVERNVVEIKDLIRLQQQNIQGRVPGSYRYQHRLLITIQRLTCGGQPRAQLWSTGLTLESSLWNGVQLREGLGSSIVGACNNPSVLLHQIKGAFPHVVPPEGEGSVYTGHQPLKLNEWTVLKRLLVDPRSDPSVIGMPAGGFSRQTRGQYLAVLPTDRALSNSTYVLDAKQLRLGGDSQDLPPLPPLVP